MYIHVRSKGSTTYRVTLQAELADTFDQTLGRAVPLVFTTGAAAPAAWIGGEDMIVQDPAGRARVSVRSVNQPSLTVHAYAVEPGDWPLFLEYRKRLHEGSVGHEPPGRRALSQKVRVKPQPDETVETSIDLDRAFPRGLGHVVVVVEPAVPMKDHGYARRAALWVQRTRIGLTAFHDASRIVVWASSLSSGATLRDVELRLLPGGATARTDAEGVVSLPLAGGGDAVLVASAGDDVAILPRANAWWDLGSTWKKEDGRDTLRWHVFDDRQMYRPGEEVRVKGLVRSLGAGPTGDLGNAVVQRIVYVLRDSQRNEVAKGEAALSPLGSFDLALALPATMNLGPASLELVAPGDGYAGAAHTHSFPVQEFRRPEFELASVASEGPHRIGGHATVTLTASYYAGGALPGAPTSWSVRAEEATFTPPNRGDYTFGFWTPWWSSDDDDGDEAAPQTFTASTDAEGRHVLRVDFDGVDPARPSRVRAEATVTDVNRQAWTARSDWLVHPADVYVGLKSERMFVPKGETLPVDVIVTDIDGVAVAGRPVELRAERMVWEQVEGRRQETASDGQDCARTSGAEPGRCTFEARAGGVYRITAVVTDAKGRRNQTQMRRWVAGGEVEAERRVEAGEVTLVPSRQEYQPGETMEILVLSPIGPAEAMLSLRRSGILRTKRFTMTAPSHTLRIPVEAGWTPNVHVNVSLVGSAPRGGETGQARGDLPLRPALASGEIDIRIPPRERTLTVAVAPREEALAPGGRTSVDVSVVDSAGQPVAASEVTLLAVDEAILSLTGYRVPDPIGTFYSAHGGGVWDFSLRTFVRLAEEMDLGVEGGVAGGVEGGVAGGVVGGMLGGLGEALDAVGYVVPQPAPAAPPAKAIRVGGALPPPPETAPIRMRSDFNPLALFVASATTDATGRARVPLTLPDSLTRYRITAVATSGARRFGMGESAITARLPLMLRPSAPRFLNFGDTIELPFVVQNQTDEPLRVDVALRVANAELTAGRGRRLRVPANDRVEVRFPVAAARAGRARFQAGAVAGDLADAAELAFPVWTPATTEAFATYGHIDAGGIVQPVAAPRGVLPRFGGIEITTSSTALSALTDAVLYLAAYPFECAEQLSSRVVAIAALKDVLTAFEAEGLPKPEEMTAAVARDVARLQQLQNRDGGFAFWRRGDPSWPYVSVHVAHALQRAKEKGFDVPQGTLDRSREYLRGIERHLGGKEYRHVYPPLVAYALYVRHRMGDSDAARARRLVRDPGLPQLSAEAVGWLLSVMSADPGSSAEVAAIRTHLANRATETASTAHFAVRYEDGAHLILHSDRRADAVLLEALIADQPKSDLIPKLVAGLLDHRVKGRWGNTQENAFVLLALDRYFNTYEKATPDFVARTWLGEDFAGEHAFRGRSTERQHIDIPMRHLADGPAPKDVVLAKEGKGRLYYRLGMRYAPASLTLEPADHGFTVERKYEGVDDPRDVRRDADGTWRVKAGTRVRVTLTMVAPSRRYHVALVDPLPAGLEALNPELATTGTLPPANGTIGVLGAPGLGGPRHPGHWWWWQRPWYDHQNLRDERTEAFSALLWEGVHAYSYFARATTPGRFVVPPPKAEEMYHPETFGRGGTDRLVVE
jgi:uncharacterized protein YfaS (alpha-2-macroglobulin family)